MENNVKQIGGKLWWCCPHCGQKTLRVSTGAQCIGLIVKCDKCKRNSEVIINKPGA